MFKKKFVIFSVAILSIILLVSCTPKKENNTIQENIDEVQTGQSIKYEGYNLDNEEVVGMEMFGDNKVNFVTVWQTTCSPCEVEMKAFEELHKKYPEINFVGISVSETSQEIKDKLNAMGVTFTNYRATENFFESTKDVIKSTPAMLVVDNTGKELIPMQEGISTEHTTPEKLAEHLEGIINNLKNEK